MEAQRLAENCRKYATESQSQKQWSGCSGGYQAEAGSRSAFFVNYFLRIIEAAAALHFATVAGIGRVRRGRTAAGGLADLALSNAVADADYHGDRYNR